MKKTDSHVENDLLRLVGKKDFEMLKKLSLKDKEIVVKSSGALETANTLNQCFWIGDENHYTIYVNEIYRKLTGYSLDEILKGKYKSDFCFTEESQKAIAKHHELRKKGLSSQYEADILTKKGVVVPVLVHGMPNGAGGTIGIFSNLQTMDKLDRDDQELMNVVGYKDFQVVKKMLGSSEQKMIVEMGPLIKIADAMQQCFWMGGKDHDTIYVNQTYRDTTEYPLEECIGKPSDFCFDEESKKCIDEHHKLRKKGVSSQYEGMYLTKTGKKVPVLIIGAPSRFGGTYGLHINLAEVKALEADKRIADQIIRNAAEAIAVLDRNRNIMLWNQGAAKIFGYEEKEVLGKSIEIVVPIDEIEASDRIMTEVEEKGFIRGVETRRITKKGEFVDVTITVSKVEDEDGKFIGYLVTYVDVTDKKRASDELQKRFETIQDAYKELGIQKRQIDYMNDIGNIAVSDTSLATLENLIVSSISLLTKADAAVLRIYDEKRDCLKLKSCIGVSSNWWSKDKINFKNSIAQEAFRKRRALIVDNVSVNMKYKGAKLLKEHRFKTLIAIPLFIHDKFVGSLSIYAVNPEKFRFIETDFLENFGRQCAMALFVKGIG